MERIEEYLEAIYDIQITKKRVAKTGDLARILNVKPSSVTEMLTKLKERGYVEYQPYRGATLTRKGEEVAKKIKKYYTISLTFFRDFLGIDEETASKLSCELEHHLNDDAAEKICRIVAGSCQVCEECTYEILKLKDVEVGEYVVVIAPLTMAEIGVKPGKTVRVDERGIIVGNEIYKIDEELAEVIFVRKIS